LLKYQVVNPVDVKGDNRHFQDITGACQWLHLIGKV